MANALGAAGGFCAGSAEIIKHQHLSGQAFTFSASLPAMLAVTAAEALKMLEADPHVLLSRMQDNVGAFKSIMKQLDARVSVSSHTKEIPLIHLSLGKRMASRMDEERILQEVVDLVSDKY